VLAGPDVEAMRCDGGRSYRRLTLGDPQFAAVRDAMLRGVSRGVYALQLHGMEHYWPGCLMRAARSEQNVADWFGKGGFPSTEDLPAALQSRWIDAVTLPSLALPADEVRAAATEEVRMFANVFGVPPEVAVPPTFVWTKEVESAWAAAGIRVVVTPGRRCESRDRESRLVSSPDEQFNAAISDTGISYVVRNNYLEPSLGHDHRRTMLDLQRNTRMGRPTLVEIHRQNFTGGDRPAQKSCDEIAALLQAARASFPSMRFMSTAELARHYRDRSEVVVKRTGTRVHVLLIRLAAFSRLRKLSWITGAILPAWLVYLVTGVSSSGESHA